MAARKKSKTTFGWGRIFGFAALLAVGFAGGYATRSYAPLPIPGDTRLAGDKPSTDSEAIQERLKSYNQQLAEARSEANKLRDKLRKVEQVQEQAEEEIAEIQIKNILAEN